MSGDQKPAASLTSALGRAWLLIFRARPAIFLKQGLVAAAITLVLFLVGTVPSFALVSYMLSRHEVRPPQVTPPDPYWVKVFGTLALPLLGVALVGVFLVITWSLARLIAATAAAVGEFPDAGRSPAAAKAPRRAAKAPGGAGNAPAAGTPATGRPTTKTGRPPGWMYEAFLRQIATAGVAASAIMVGTAAFVVPGLVAFLALSMALPAVVLEEKDTVAALRQSLFFFRANPAPVTASGLIIVAAAAVGYVLSAATGPLMFLIAPLTGAVLLPWGAAALTLVFLDCRKRTPQTLKGEK